VVSTPSHVTGIHDDGDNIVLELEDGESATTRSVLIATGADYCKLNVPGREKFEGRGVYYAATPTELSSCSGSEVIVVGAGNSAGQAAMFLSRNTRKVLLLVRGGDLKKNMSSYLAERIEANDGIEVVYHTSITRMEGDEHLERVEVENSETGEKRMITTPAVFTFIGAVPRTEWLRGTIETDDKGFVRTGRAVSRADGWKPDRWPYLLETSHPGVFAAGDVRLGSAKRVASAVGEGSMAVMFVHEFLTESQPATASA
ncbi:MAG: NAD(P)/FAD-dependent oxidoreductase, partial [Gemmatimonadota bacterium]|nr:NAD(P)/FAD-dependent oxidoreductase [Gemmatimonadota bacterium]